MFRIIKIFKSSPLLVLFIVATVFIGLYIRLGNLNYDLWYDEAGQFWIAMGLNHFTLDFQRHGIYDVLINNRLHNLDPPLFGILLHVWTFFNTSILWLRLLPSILGLFTLFFIFRTLKLLKVSRIIVSLTIIFVFLSYPFVSYSQELRAYSLGFLSSSAIFYYMVQFFINPRKGFFFIRLIIWVLIGINTLYSIWLLLPLLFVSILYIDYKTKDYIHTIVFVCVTSFTVLLLFYFQTRFQLGGLQLDYLNIYKLGNYHTLESLLRNFYLLNVRFVGYLFGSSFIIHNIFAPYYSEQLFFLVTLIGSVFLIFFLKDIFLLLRYKYRYLWYPILFYFLLFVEINILSLLNLFPISPHRWNLFQGPMLIIIMAILIHLVIKKYSYMKLPLFIIYLLIIVVNIFNSLYIPEETGNLRSALKLISLDNALIYVVSYQIFPTFKYYYMGKNSNLIFYPDSSESFSNKIRNVNKFLDSAGEKKFTQNKMIILLSGETEDVYDNVVVLLGRYALNHMLSLHIYKYKDIEMIVLQKS